MTTTTTSVVDQGLFLLLGFSVLAFAAIVATMVYFVLRYHRSRNPRATEVHGNPWFEVAVFSVSIVLVLVFFFVTLGGYQFLRRVPEGALQVKVHTRQFAFSFEYPGGKVVPDMVVPVGSDIRLDISSDDVLHGVFIPAYHIQVDAVPGMPTYAWFHAQEVGVVDLLCTVYCGTAHSGMMSKVYVVPVADFQRWKDGESVSLGSEKLPSVMAGGADLLDARGCIGCHTIDGAESAGPSFKGLFGSKITIVKDGQKSVIEVDEAYLAASIRKPGESIVLGFDDMMPPGDDLKDEEVEDMVEAIKTFK